MSNSGFHIYKLESLNIKLKSHNKRVSELKEQGYKEDFTDIVDANNYGKYYLRTRLVKEEDHNWVETTLQESRK